jgi:hypothetical protein
MISANLTLMASEKPDAQIVVKVPDESQPAADRRCSYTVRGHLWGDKVDDGSRS